MTNIDMTDSPDLLTCLKIKSKNKLKMYGLDLPDGTVDKNLPENAG